MNEIVHWSKSIAKKSDSRHLHIRKHPGKHLMSLNSYSLSFTCIAPFNIGVRVGS